MRLDEIESIAGVAVEEFPEIILETQRRNSETFLTLSMSPEGEGSRSATIITTGTEAFCLRLDTGLQWQDFDWEDRGQEEILTTMIRIGREYISGGGTLRRKRGIVRYYPVFEIKLDGSIYSFK